MGGVHNRFQAKLLVAELLFESALFNEAFAESVETITVDGSDVCREYQDGRHEKHNKNKAKSQLHTALSYRWASAQSA